MKFTRTQWETIRANMRRHHITLSSEVGVFVVNRSEGLQHNLKMAEQFARLSYAGFAVAVRPKIGKKGIPDLVILDTHKPIAKEILVSETDKRFKEKDYGIQTIKVR